MEKSRRIRTKFILPLIVSGVFIVFFLVNVYFSEVNLTLQKFIFRFALVTVSSFTISFLHLAIAEVLIRFLDRQKILFNNWKRWVIEGGVVMVLALLITWFLISTSSMSGTTNANLPFQKFMFMLFPNVLFGVIMFAIVESWNSFEENRNLQLSLANTEKEKVASQLLALQQKVNPHFLFNSLSVLSELVYENPEKANSFIEEFTKVYRYVLDFKEETLVTVKQELEFLEAYLFLQNIRFGDRLQVDIQLSEEVKNHRIPPLSLQLLFENAIKHNRISNTEPLIIQLKSDKSRLIISNNLQHRMEVKHSKGIGLSTLIKTYALISEEQPDFQETTAAFIVKLPLITTLN